MEYQNDSVEEILEQLKSAHNGGGTRPDKAEIDEMLDRFGRALDELTVQLRRESLVAV